MKWIEYSDLSHNNLIGDVPDFLSQMSSLKVLKLEGNQLSGKIALVLLDRSEKGLLNISCHGNPNLCCPGSCNKRRRHNNNNKVVIPLVASLGGAFIMFAAITLKFKTRQPAATSLNKPRFDVKLSKGLHSNKQQFTYAEVQSITNNFGRVLGKGGFGAV